MRYLLVCRYANGARNACKRVHECGSRLSIELTDITHVLSRDHQREAGVKLPTIHKRHRQLVLPDDASRLCPAHNFTKDTSHIHASLPRLQTLRRGAARQRRARCRGLTLPSSSGGGKQTGGGTRNWGSRGGESIMEWPPISRPSVARNRSGKAETSPAPQS